MKNLANGDYDIRFKFADTKHKEFEIGYAHLNVNVVHNYESDEKLHDPGEKVPVKCNHCNDKQVVTIPPLDKLESDGTYWKVEKNAECTVDGEGRYTDPKTKATIRVRIPMTGHNYTGQKWEITDPTYTTKGEARKHCKNAPDDASHDDVKELPLLSDNGWNITRQPTCKDAGSATLKSDPTIVVEIPVDPSKHKPGKTITVNANCDREGYTSTRCEICQNERAHTIIPKRADDWSSWEMVVKPTKNEKGKGRRYCKYEDCTHEQWEDIPKLSDTNSWDKTNENKPDRYKPGDETYKWKNPSNDKDYGEVFVVIPPDGHDCSAGVWRIEVYPTEQETGLAVRTCTLAEADSKHKNHVENAVLPKLPTKQELQNNSGIVTRWQNLTLPTCDKEGKGLALQCQVTEYVNGVIRSSKKDIQVDKIPALGHKWSPNWTFEQPKSAYEKVVLHGVCGRDKTHTTTEDISYLRNSKIWTCVENVWTNPKTKYPSVIRKRRPHDEYILLDSELIAHYNGQTVTYYDTQNTIRADRTIDTYNNGIIKIYMPAGSKNTGSSSGSSDRNDFNWDEYNIDDTEPCDHDYQWTVKEQPTDKTSPITLIGICSKCGNRIERVVPGLSDTSFWNKTDLDGYDDYYTGEYGVTIRYTEPLESFDEPESDISDIPDSNPDPVTDDVPPSSDSDNNSSSSASSRVIKIKTPANGNPYTGLTTILILAGAAAIMIAAYHRKHKK